MWPQKGTPPDYGADSFEMARKLFAGPCDFMLGVAAMAQLPAANLPEIAFAGRSNVGKSSLLNALTNRQSLARTSNTPGRTRELNFFSLGDRLRLVDLPGYGYARASKTQIAGWTTLTRDYLRGRAPLRRVCILIDSRHGIKAADEGIMDLLDKAAVPYQLVYTKIDKVKHADLDRVIGDTDRILKKRPAAFPWHRTTSSNKNIGFDALRADLAALASDSSAE